MTDKKSGGDLFIVDNADDDWKVQRYLRDWCDIARPHGHLRGIALFPKSCYHLEHSQQSPRHPGGLRLAAHPPPRYASNPRSTTWISRFYESFNVRLNGSASSP